MPLCNTPSFSESTRMIALSRAPARKYSPNDQHFNFPNRERIELSLVQPDSPGLKFRITFRHGREVLRWYKNWACAPTKIQFHPKLDFPAVEFFGDRQ